MKLPPVRTILLLLVLLSPLAVAQDGEVEFELGVRGAVVANEWNPIRLVVRDLPAARLEVIIDSGSLRSGPMLAVYTASIPASSGVRVFEDDLYVPAWRSMTWTLRTSDRTVASGSLDPRGVDARPLTLLLSLTPGKWLDQLPDGSRPLEIGSLGLPERAAAFAGVEVLLVDGTAAAPTVAALVAAATGGARVLLIEPLPDSHRDLLRLVEQGSSRLGAGWLVAAGAEDVTRLVEGLPQLPLEQALFNARLDQGPPSPALSALLVTLAAAGYSLVVLLLFRFGGAAGPPAALLVGCLTGLAAWTLLRPAEALIIQEHELLVSAGGLALNLPVTELRSLPGGEATVSGRLRPADQMPYLNHSEGTEVVLDRWQQVTLLGRPLVDNDRLRWDGEQLVNTGTRSLTDLLVADLGPQPSLPAGESLIPQAREDGEVPLRYRGLLELVPPGTVLATDGNAVIVLLPPSFGGST